MCVQASEESAPENALVLPFCSARRRVDLSARKSAQRTPVGQGAGLQCGVVVARSGPLPDVATRVAGSSALVQALPRTVNSDGVDSETGDQRFETADPISLLGGGTVSCTKGLALQAHALLRASVSSSQSVEPTGRVRRVCVWRIGAVRSEIGLLPAATANLVALAYIGQSRGSRRNADADR